MKEVSLFIGTKNNAVQFLMERESEQKEELTNVCSINSCGMSVQPTDVIEISLLIHGIVSTTKCEGEARSVRIKQVD